MKAVFFIKPRKNKNHTNIKTVAKVKTDATVCFLFGFKEELPQSDL